MRINIFFINRLFPKFLQHDSIPEFFWIIFSDK